MMIKDVVRDREGFTLIEAVIVMVLVGLIFAALIGFYLKWDKAVRYLRTHENINIVADAMSAYAARNYRVPCPADVTGGGIEPFGYERGSGTNGADVGDCDSVAAGEVEGIVPFKTLGLTHEQARDAWGNYFTYQVTPYLAEDPSQDPEIEAGDNEILVHAKCRTTQWIEGKFITTDGVYDGGQNINAAKARFCCRHPGPGGDPNAGAIDLSQISEVRSQLSGSPSFNLYSDPDSGNNNWYARADIIADPFDDTNSDGDPSDPVGTGTAFYDETIYGDTGAGANKSRVRTDMTAYVLISHGENGAGAFLPSGARMPGGSTVEQANADAANQIVTDLARNTTNTDNYFDDIIFWQSQSQLLARLNRDSCMVP